MSAARAMWVGIGLAAALGLLACSGSSGGGGAGSTGKGTVGAAGGDVVTTDGKVKVSIPAGALAADTEITITQAKGGAPADLAAFFDGTTATYDLEPEGTVFAVPVTVRVLLDDAPIRADGTMEVPVVAAEHVFAAGSAPLDNLRLEVDAAANTASVVGEIGHFSKMSVGIEVKNPTTKKKGTVATVSINGVPDAAAVGESHDVAAVLKAGALVQTAFTLTYADDSKSPWKLGSQAGQENLDLAGGGHAFGITSVYSCESVGKGAHRATVTFAPAAGAGFKLTDGRALPAALVTGSVDFPVDDPNGGQPVDCVQRTVNFKTVSQKSADESGTLTATVETNAPADADITVPFNVAGTASPGVDFTVTQSPVKIKKGATSVDIVVTITEDTQDETNETAVLSLGTPSAGTLGTKAVHTATITDDDTATGGGGLPDDQTHHTSKISFEGGYNFRIQFTTVKPGRGKDGNLHPLFELPAGEYAVIAHSAGATVFDLVTGGEKLNPFPSVGALFGALALHGQDGDFVVGYGAGGVAQTYYDTATDDFGATQVGAFTSVIIDGFLPEEQQNPFDDRYALVTTNLDAVEWFQAGDVGTFNYPRYRHVDGTWYDAAHAGKATSAQGGFDTPALVLTGGVPGTTPGEVWFGEPIHDAPVEAHTGSKVGAVGDNPLTLRCLGTVCAVTNFGSDTITVLHRPDPDTAPTITDTVAVDDGPVGVDLADDGAGGVVVLTTGFNGGGYTLTPVDVDGNAGTPDSHALADCDSPGYAWFVGAGASHVAVACNGDGNLRVVERP